MPSVLGKRQQWRTSEKIWLPAVKDISGNPVTNSAGQIPAKPYYESVSIGVIHIVEFKPYTDAEYKAELNAVNSGGWKSWNAKQAWISEIHTSGEKTIGSDTGEEVHYVVRCIDRADGWRLAYPDVGLAFVIPGGFEGFEGYIGNLDGSGGDGGGTMNILTADLKKSIDFTALLGA